MRCSFSNNMFCISVQLTTAPDLTCWVNVHFLCLSYALRMCGSIGSVGLNGP